MSSRASAAGSWRRGLRLWRFLPALVCMAAIFALSARSGGELNSWLPYFRAWLPGLQSFDPMHYAAYFTLALAFAFGFGSHAFTWKGAAWIVILCVLYGATDEWHQAYVPNRSPDWRDLWHDTIGAAAACAILLIYRYVRDGRKR